jgi:hypothetical protein
MSVHITIGKGKMNQINSINTNNLTNEFCKRNSENPKLICSKCYANRLVKFRKQLEIRLQNNSELLSKKIIARKDLPTINALYFRINSFGEIINKKHLINIFNIAKKNPKTNFTLWSKRVKIFTKEMMLIKPNNLQLIYSNPILDNKSEIIPKNFNKIFTVYSSKYVKDNNIKINCEKNCMTCLKCYKPNKIKYIREKLK